MVFTGAMFTYAVRFGLVAFYPSRKSGALNTHFAPTTLLRIQADGFRSYVTPAHPPHPPERGNYGGGRLCQGAP